MFFNTPIMAKADAVYSEADPLIRKNLKTALSFAESLLTRGVCFAIIDLNYIFNFFEVENDQVIERNGDLV